MKMMTTQMNNINVIFPKLYKAQRQVVKSCLFGDDKYITLNGSRQIGKTFILSYLALYWALSEKDAHIMIVSPTDAQVKKIYDQIIETIGEGYKTLLKTSKQSSGSAKMMFKTGSAILFRSAESENSLRGYSNTHLLLDECAFIKESTWQTILAPTLSVRGKKVFFCSTPKGLNFFHKMYSTGLGSEPGYKSFKITYHQNPYAKQGFIEQQRQVLPDDVFRQEYLGEFIDASSVFKNIDELAILKRRDTKTLAETITIGVDIAFKKDYTVAVALNDEGDMVDYIRFNNEDTLIVVKNIKDFINKWQPQKTIIEDNNQGLPIIHLLQNEGCLITPFNTNTSTKPDLINELMVAFNKKEIRLINEDIIKEEFKSFTYLLSKTGKVQFAAAYGHDDIVMATAFAYKGKVKGFYRPTMWS